MISHSNTAYAHRDAGEEENTVFPLMDSTRSPDLGQARGSSSIHMSAEWDCSGQIAVLQRMSEMERYPSHQTPAPNEHLLLV